MFWRKDKKLKSKTSDKRGSLNKSKAGCVGKKEGHGQTREEIHAAAMANFSTARAHIGEDTLERIAAAMDKKQQSAMERAKRDIANADINKILDELKWMQDQKT